MISYIYRHNLLSSDIVPSRESKSVPFYYVRWFQYVPSFDEIIKYIPPSSSFFDEKSGVYFMKEYV